MDLGSRLAHIDPTFIGEFLIKKPILTLDRDEITLLAPRGRRQKTTRIDDAIAFADTHRLSLICRLDEDGAVVCEPAREPVRVPAFKVEVADTIAAGDSHCAGVIAGMASGLPLSHSTLLGNMVAAITVSRPGSNGAPTRAESEAFQAQDAG